MNNWKDIPGFEGLYQATPDGKIRSLNRIAKWQSRSRQVWGKEMVQRLNKCGYLMVHLRKDGRHCYLRVNRVIALTFIPNPENKPWVNHIDCNKLNNSADNLEWCTAKENSQHAIKLGRFIIPKKGAQSTCAKKVVQIKDGVEINTWGSVADASIHLKADRYNIANAARGMTKQAAGFEWKYI